MFPMTWLLSPVEGVGLVVVTVKRIVTSSPTPRLPVQINCFAIGSQATAPNVAVASSLYIACCNTSLRSSTTRTPFASVSRRFSAVIS